MRAVGVALVAGGALLLEVALTRLLSAVFLGPHVYVVLSLALFGLGLGAAASALLPSARSRAALPAWALLAGASAAALALLAPWAWRAPTALLALAAVLPFAGAGAALAGAFAAAPERSPRLYLADLAGAAAGALLALPALATLGGPGAVALAGSVTALGAAPLAPRRRGAWALPALALAATLLVLPPLGPADAAPGKPARAALAAGARLEASRWSSLGRADLLVRPDGSRVLYLDGGAGSLVPDRARAESWADDVASFAFAVLEPERVFLLGPGGGLDVALARLHGAREIVAAEIHRAGVALVRALGETTGDVYGPGTELLPREGRAALRRDARAYDLVLLSHAVSRTAELRGLALSENGLYTVEAMGEYLDALRPGGAVALELYDEPTLTRAITTALQALRERGVTDADAARHLFAVLEPAAGGPVPLLLVARDPLGRERAVAWARRAERQGLALLWVPGLLAPPALDGVFEGRAGLEQAVAAAAASGVDVRPARDERPFFFHFGLGLPDALRAPLAAVGLAALAALAAALRPRRARRAAPRLLPVAFAALGAAFLLVELAALRRASLLIADPPLALALTLAALLIGAGAGAQAFGAWAGPRPPLRAAALGALASGVGAGLWWLAWPGLAPALDAAAPPLRLAGVALALAALGLPLGMAFPQALRAAGRHGPGEVALGWALNGLAAVAGGVGATALALAYGYGATLAAGVALYACAALALARAASTHAAAAARASATPTAETARR